MTHTPLRPAASEAAATPPTAEPKKTSAGPDKTSAGPEKTRHAKWRWITAGSLTVIAIGLGAYAMSRSDADPGTTPVAPATTTARSGSDGNFAFTVTGTTCGVRTVGPAVLAQRPAAGQFCLVNVSVRNLGTGPELLDPGAQHAIDDQGRQYPVSDRAVVFLNEEDPTLLAEIPPGATVPGVLAFDVPDGVRLDAIALHESVASPGVRLPLS